MTPPIPPTAVFQHEGGACLDNPPALLNTSGGVSRCYSILIKVCAALLLNKIQTMASVIATQQFPVYFA